MERINTLERAIPVSIPFSKEISKASNFIQSVAHNVNKSPVQRNGRCQNYNHTAPQRIALDFEFVRFDRKTMIRTAAFTAIPETGANSYSLCGEKIVEQKSANDNSILYPPYPTIIYTLRPSTTLQLAHILPAGHALRSGKDAVLRCQNFATEMESGFPSEEKNYNLANTAEPVMGCDILSSLHTELNTKAAYFLPNIRTLNKSVSLEDVNAELCTSLLNRVDELGSMKLYRLFERAAQPYTNEAKALIWGLYQCYHLSQKELRRMHKIFQRYDSYSSSTLSSSTKMVNMGTSSFENFDQSLLGSSAQNLGDYECLKAESESDSSLCLPRVRCCNSLEHLGKELYRYLHTQAVLCPNTKMYCYGNSDHSALIETLEASVPKSVEVEPHVVRLLRNMIDFTHDTAFYPIYQHFGNRIPKLHEALQLMANDDWNSGPLFSSYAPLSLLKKRIKTLVSDSDAHNPVWDAYALALLIQGCDL